MSPTLLNSNNTVLAQLSWDLVQRYHVQRLFGDEVLMKNQTSNTLTHPMYVHHVNYWLLEYGHRYAG
ncbi:hypothetical protein J2T13_000337 [Paenibacillus sp. DS2015]|uniref:hypothetical protein n=1 Tax=Paenibacillus sp. DS2015 TaxID=3373917 RepID=UPI003D2056F7